MIDNNKNYLIKSHTYNDLTSDILKYKNKFLNIVIDLDHTIIYTKVFDSSEIFKIKIIKYLYSDYYLGKFVINSKTYLIFIRPYFNYFINTVSMYFNIYIYTNSHKTYCLNIINLIKNKYNNFNIVKIIYRENNNSLIKYLRILCENIDDYHFVNDISYDNFIKKTIIIDDSTDVWLFDKKNLIDIKKFIVGEDNYTANIDLNDNFVLDKNIHNNSLIYLNDEFDKDNPNQYNIFNGYNFIFSNKNSIKDDILLILSNRLFIIYNLYMEKYVIDENFNIQELIRKYKL